MSSDKPQILEAQGVIFDVDGTLVDSVDFHAQAWQRALVSFGFSFDLAAVRAQIGKGGDQLLPYFLDHDDRERFGHAIQERRAEIFERDYMHLVRGFEGVPDLFRLLVDSGKVIALGSSAKGKDLVVYKKAAGIEGIPMAEITSDDVRRSKPHPDIFLVALERLRLRAGQVMVVGDSPYDVLAAHKAGMTATALLCGGFSESSLVRAGAMEIYRDPKHLLQAARGIRISA
jgi:beta-phosphoglucomutase-like phosphatase (HAD superfamily)